MSKLVCTKEFLNDLVKQSIIEPQGNNEFILYTKANLIGECYPITISCDVNTSVKAGNKFADNNSKNLNEWYDIIRVEFPTNAGAHLSIDGRNLRSGNKTKIKKRIQALIEESYNMEAVQNAIRFEVWFRVKGSTVNNNKLDFMQGLEAWLNNTSNIDAMIERSQESNEYKIAMNIHKNNGDKGPERKIKLA